jgi:hypothetical protein
MSNATRIVRRNKMKVRLGYNGIGHDWAVMRERRKMRLLSERPKKKTASSL